MKIYIQPLKTILLAVILSFGISFVYAWTGPTATPPAGNTTAPINTSTGSQYKNGALGVGGILIGYSDLTVSGPSSFNSSLGVGGLIHGYSNAIFDGNVGIGTATPTVRLDINGGIKATGGSPIYSCPETTVLCHSVGLSVGTCIGQLSLTSSCNEAVAINCTGDGCDCGTVVNTCPLVGRLVAP